TFVLLPDRALQPLPPFPHRRAIATSVCDSQPEQARRSPLDRRFHLIGPLADGRPAESCTTLLSLLSNMPREDSDPEKLTMRKSVIVDIIALAALIPVGATAQQQSLASTLDVYVLPREGQESDQQSADEASCYDRALTNPGSDRFDLAKQQ